ncbi:unnamed protein product, partial [Amoebophrya sp. A120]
GNWARQGLCSHCRRENRGYSAHVYEFVPPVPVYAMRISNRNVAKYRLDYSRVFYRSTDDHRLPDNNGAVREDIVPQYYGRWRCDGGTRVWRRRICKGDDYQM